jgi:hypothetical protein
MFLSQKSESNNEKDTSCRRSIDEPVHLKPMSSLQPTKQPQPERPDTGQEEVQRSTQKGIPSLRHVVRTYVKAPRDMNATETA